MQIPVEGSNQTPLGTDQCMDICEQPVQTLLSDGPSEQNIPEMDYGPWLVVSHLRGHARGHGGGAHATHMTTRTAAETITPITDSRGTNSLNLHGGHRNSDSGRYSVSHTPHSYPSSDPPPSTSTTPQLANPTVGSLEISPTHIENCPLCHSISPENISISHATTLIAFPNQIIPFRRDRDVGKSHTSDRPHSPPSILRSSLPSLSFPPNSLGSSHNSLVERVSNALKSGDIEEDSDEDDDLEDEDEDGMSEGDPNNDSPDDSMTSVQYQEEARSDAHIRKSTLVAKVSPKKRRMEDGSSRS